MPDKTGKQTQTKGTCKPVNSKKKIERNNAKQQTHVCKMPDWA